MTATVSKKQLLKENVTKKLFTLVDNIIRDVLNTIQTSNRLRATVNSPTALLNSCRRSHIHMDGSTYTINVLTDNDKLCVDVWVDANDKPEVLFIEDDLIGYIKAKVVAFDIPTTISFNCFDRRIIPVTIVKYEHNPKTT